MASPAHCASRRCCSPSRTASACVSSPDGSRGSRRAQAWPGHGRRTRPHAGWGTGLAVLDCACAPLWSLAGCLASAWVLFGLPQCSVPLRSRANPPPALRGSAPTSQHVVHTDLRRAPCAFAVRPFRETGAHPVQTFHLCMPAACRLGSQRGRRCRRCLARTSLECSRRGAPPKQRLLWLALSTAGRAGRCTQSVV